MTTLIENMADWASSLRYEDLPDRVVRKAKLQFLSMMAAVYSGYPTRTARAIREVILSTRAQGRSTVFPQGEPTSPTVAVVANAAASAALDYDDYVFLSHTGHSAVLASLAQTQESGLSGRHLLCAQIIANEISGRLGASVILGPQNGQLWTHIHAAGAACAGAKILDLSPEQTAHAMALSLYQPPLAMWPGFMGPDSKLLSAAFPARDGLMCARLASWGLTGPLDILENKLGFGQHFSYQFLPQMFSGLGEAWLTDTLSYKIYPGCAYIDSALDALFDTMEQFQAANDRPLEAGDIVEASVHTTLLGAEMCRLTEDNPQTPLKPVQVNYSLPHSLALALLAGKLTPAELHEQELKNRQDEIRAIAQKFEIVHDWSLTLSLFEGISENVPLRSLLSEIDLKQILSLWGETGRSLGASLIPSPKDLLRIGSFLWARAPGLVRQASRVATSGIPMGKDKEEKSFNLAQAQLASLPMRLGSELILHLRGNRKLSARVEIPSGAAGRDAAETEGLVRKKFRDLATPFLDQGQVQHALDLIDQLEDLPNLSELSKCLCVP